MIDIVLADDYAVVRAGIKLLINVQPDMQVVGEASTEQMVLAVVHATPPDLVLIDIAMQELNGVQTIAALKCDFPMIKVVVLTAHKNITYLREVLAIGVSGYVLKHTAADVVMDAIRQVVAGGMYIDSTLASYIVVRSVRGGKATTRVRSADLTDRERDVLHRVAHGFNNQQIADHLFLSVKTVEIYRIRGMQKLGLTSRVALVHYALNQGWLRSSEEAASAE